MVKYCGLIYWFVNVKNCDVFKVNLVCYVFQFDGYCVFGVVCGYKVGVDLLVFKVVFGKFYVNYLKFVQCIWNWDVLGFIKQVNVNWFGLK